MTKLRKALTEHGTVVYNPRCVCIYILCILYNYIITFTVQPPHPKKNTRNKSISALELRRADLAFPNGEHHLPISSFGTEQVHCMCFIHHFL